MKEEEENVESHLFNYDWLDTSTQKYYDENRFLVVSIFTASLLPRIQTVLSSSFDALNQDHLLNFQQILSAARQIWDADVLLEKMIKPVTARILSSVSFSFSHSSFLDPELDARGVAAGFLLHVAASLPDASPRLRFRRVSALHQRAVFLFEVPGRSARAQIRSRRAEASLRFGKPRSATIALRSGKHGASQARHAAPRAANRSEQPAAHRLLHVRAGMERLHRFGHALRGAGGRVLPEMARRSVRLDPPARRESAGNRAVDSGLAQPVSGRAAAREPRGAAVQSLLGYRERLPRRDQQDRFSAVPKAGVVLSRAAEPEDRRGQSETARCASWSRL